MNQLQDTRDRESTGRRSGPDALYLHVPFCFHKCHYCDFYSVEHDAVRQPTVQADYTDALIRELQHHAALGPLRPATLFVGGGTPTLLRPDLWRRLLDALRDCGATQACHEFTVEANPETVNLEIAQVLAAGGVNRVSLGAQSFHPGHLKTLERWHDPASVPRALDHLRAAGITNLNLDLIFAIPGQTLAEALADVDTALALAPTHLSTYSLTYEPNTAMTRRLQLRQFTPAPEELERDMYAAIIDHVEAAGFEHYEVSAFAARTGSGARVSGSADADVHNSDGTRHPEPGARALCCHHNLAYWRNANWLGLGASAASHVDGRRWQNAPRVSEYIADSPRPPVADDETLTPSQRVGDALMLGLRLREGVALDWLDAQLVGDDKPARRRRERIDHFVTLGLLERTATHLRLTRPGLFVADAVLAELI